MTGLNLSEFRAFVLADLHALGAAGVELAALGGIGGRRNAAFKNNAVNLRVGIRNRNSREESLCIRMQRILSISEPM